MILQQPIQRKLSALLGAPVTFDKLNFSLLGGSIEAVGMKVGDLLTVDRIVAKVAVGRAIKGEIVVTSLTIEKPVVTLIRSADGTFNLPKGSKAEPPQSSSEPKNASDDHEDQSRWSFDAEKVLVIDGTIELSANAGYRASIEKLLLELKQKDTGYSVTLLADSVGRRDIPLDLGQLRGTATIANAANLTALPRAAAEANLELGEKIKLKLRTPEIRGRVVDVAFAGTVDFGLLKSLLP